MTPFWDLLVLRLFTAFNVGQRATLERAGDLLGLAHDLGLLRAHHLGNASIVRALLACSPSLPLYQALLEQERQRQLRQVHYREALGEHLADSVSLETSDLLRAGAGASVAQRGALRCFVEGSFTPGLWRFLTRLFLCDCTDPHLRWLVRSIERQAAGSFWDAGSPVREPFLCHLYRHTLRQVFQEGARPPAREWPRPSPRFEAPLEPDEEAFLRGALRLPEPVRIGVYLTFYVPLDVRQFACALREEHPGETVTHVAGQLQTAFQRLLHWMSRVS